MRNVIGYHDPTRSIDEAVGWEEACFRAVAVGSSGLP